MEVSQAGRAMSEKRKVRLRSLARPARASAVTIRPSMIWECVVKVCMRP